MPAIQVKAIDWNSPEAQHARDIRMTVFVGEQNVPADIELDDTDPIAYHVLARTPDGVPVGTGRLFTDERHSDCGHIGRMAVLKSARGTGCGSAIMEALMQEARRRKYRRIELSSQVHAMPFYARHGFKAFGPEYLDAAIPHRMMGLDLG